VRTTATRSGVLVRLLALLVVPALIAAACGGDDDDGGGGGGGGAASGGGASTTVLEDEGEPQRGGSVVYGVEADTSNPWTPQRSTCAISCYIVFNSVYDPLVLIDEDGEPQPNLLESFESNDDFTEWTLTPRDGITFHDDTPFDAEAIRYNLQDQLDSALTQAALKSVDTVALNADGTAAVVRMKESWSNFPTFLAAQLGYMASPTWRAATKTDPPTALETEPVGTGPFVFEEYEVGSHFRATRNENYWKQDPEGQQLPYLDEVEIRILPEAQTRINGLESGELDIAHTANGQLVKRLRDNESVDEIEVDRFGETNYIMINVDEGEGSNANPALLDVNVRKALAMGINKQTLIDTVGGGIGRPANGPFPPGSVGYLEDTGYPEYDTDEAQRLITEYEEANGPVEITYTTTNDSANRRTAEVLQGMWDAIGVDMSIDQVEQGSFILDSAFGAMQIWGWRSHGGYDPDQQSVWWHSSSYAPTGEISLNFNHFQDPEIDEAFDTIRQSGDEDERKAAAEDVNRRFGEQVYDLWTSWTVWSIGHKPEVQGIASGALPDGSPSTISGGAAHQLAQIWVER